MNIFKKLFNQKSEDNDIEKISQSIESKENSNDKFSNQVDINLNGQDNEQNGEIEVAIKEYEKNINEGFEGNHPYDRLAILQEK